MLSYRKQRYKQTSLPHADPEPEVTPHVTTGGQCCPTEAAQVWA